ncbi:hypothetical protein [Oxalicibacterium solurbis]|uniref:Uncharacterized protein n=1 Tax=Oxalicibacterium solurbis TaxID=69280 RepID=A0A8J3AXH4_9BURK|nr:hypothetical protein [Oxalicibacterium solurbis]GGI55010.1 hypothetical protein GCM10011430_21840 [Oxalicibacterium solurbis]
MTNRDPNDPGNRTETLAEQKERLILQCRAYRIAVGNAKSVVRANMGPDAIAKTAVGMVSARAQSALANFSDLLDFRSLSGAKLQKLLPLVISGVSLLSRRSLWKPVLRGAAVVGAAGAGLYLFSRRRKKHEHVARHEQL